MKKTKLYTAHQKYGAKIIDFAGYQMPVQYTSMIAEHQAVRNAAGLFDVSHMGEFFVRGKQALDLVQHVTVNNAALLKPGKIQYSAMCYEDGGIVDDLLVYMISQEEFLLVVNASNIEKDFQWITSNNTFDATVTDESDEWSLIAFQGTISRGVLQSYCDSPLELEYYHFMYAKVCGIDTLVSRTGYTGELGYELYIKAGEEEVLHIWDSLYKTSSDKGGSLTGLGARDTLRLEMGYCLYGNDIDAATNPLEAGLSWITKLNKTEFIGRDALLEIKNQGLKRKLCAFTSDEKIFPRHGYSIFNGNENIGVVTSGTVSPVLNKPIGMAYIDSRYSETGTELEIEIRGKRSKIDIVKLPFILK